MGVRMPSKWDIRRVSKLVGATVLPKLTVTTPDEVGFADIVDCQEIAGQKVTRFQRSESRISTILIRGSTDNFMDDVERAIESGINTYKALTRVRTQNCTLQTTCTTIWSVPSPYSILWPP